MPDLSAVTIKKRHAEDDPQRTDLPPRKSKKKRSSLASRDGWTISRGVGGSIIPLDPVFSDDGEAIIIAYPNSVRVFSTRTSLLLRSLEVGKGKITGLVCSLQNPLEILVSTDQGRLNKWNWAEDLRANMYDLGRRICGLASVGCFPESIADVLCTIEDIEDLGKKETENLAKYVNCITFHALSREGLENRRGTIYRSKTALSNLRVLRGGECIIASAGSQLIVGILRGANSLPSLDQLAYTWYQLDTPGQISCLDFFLKPRITTGFDVDIAVGTSSGPIHLYSNIISELHKAAKRKAQTNPSVQRLHWHRYAVRTVKFSRDGNYLVSGGMETVLCSWQLDTGKRQDLPHLTASIENLTISPDGASYAVALGNNSVIILSTLDFKPTFAFTGPSWPVTDDPKRLLNSFPAVVRPEAIPTQLLLATPSSTQDDPGNGSLNAVYLQTIDTRTGLQLSKQALTRNNATDRITSPQGHLIAEPNVNLMAVSQDGQWLATVEKWVPLIHEEHSTEGSLDSGSSVLSRPEIFLKFWTFNQMTNSWELSSRVDEPHAENPYDNCDVLDLRAIPSGFMTIGADGHIRTWRQQYRKRNNLPVADKDGRQLINWYCTSVSPGPPSPIVDDIASPISAAKLAASTDGSLVALILQYHHATTICLIDVPSQTIISVRNDLPLRCLHDIAILDRYLVVLSDHLLVWDLVQDAVHFSYTFQNTSLLANSQAKLSYLAAHALNSFAIAIPTKSGNSSQIAVFDPRSSEPLTVHQLNESIRGIFPQSSPEGFIVLTDRSHVYQLTPLNALTNDFEEEIFIESRKTARSLLGKDLPVRDLLGTEMEMGGAEVGGPEAILVHQEEYVITQSKLAELYEMSSTATTVDTVSMFERIAKLAIGRPR